MSTRFQVWMANLNLTTYKGVWTVWLWVATAGATYAVILVSAWRGTDVGMMAVQVYASWLFGLAAFSGITTAEYYGKRTTDTQYQMAKNTGAPSPVVEASRGAKVDVVVQPPATATAPAVVTIPPANGDVLDPMGNVEPDMYRDDERGQ